MIHRWFFALLLACMTFLPGQALATKIVMVIKTSVTVTDASVDVRLEVRNNGDEDSLVVTPFLALAGVETGLESAPYIAFEGGRIWTHSFSTGDLAVSDGGVYPLITRLRYHDANMYPYSMVSARGVQIGGSPPAIIPVKGEILAEQITDEGTLDLRLINTGSLPLDVQLSMVSPTELVIHGDRGWLNLPVGEEKQVSYVIKNNGSLPGSNYNVLATVEYSLDGKHGLVILEETVVVDKYISNKKRTIIIGSAMFIAFLFFVVLLFELRVGVGTK